jgi:hypothetical protein
MLIKEKTMNVEEIERLCPEFSNEDGDLYFEGKSASIYVHFALAEILGEARQENEQLKGQVAALREGLLNAIPLNVKATELPDETLLEHLISKEQARKLLYALENTQATAEAYNQRIRDDERKNIADWVAGLPTTKNESFNMVMNALAESISLNDPTDQEEIAAIFKALT